MKTPLARIRPLVISLLAALTVGVAILAITAGGVAEPSVSSSPDPKWLDRLDKVDRVLVDEHVGFAPPAFSDDLDWRNGDAPTWEGLRGNVVVLQTWTSATRHGRKAVSTMRKVSKKAGSDDVRVVMIHTPEGADRANAFLERSPISGMIAVDQRGTFCDAVGAYKRPVNIVVDRNGAVRYAGLNARGLDKVVPALLAEEHDAARKPAPRAAAVVKAEFPQFTGQVSSARDIRGTAAPKMAISHWIESEPEWNDKVVVIDFWATWCGPCRKSIPHMNDLAARFADDACFIGISDEAVDKFQAGMKRYKLDSSSFKYALALDTSARMKRTVGIRGIPHCLVMSRDWTVRWQGHPMSLEAEALAQIIRADTGQPAKAPRKHPRNRWTGTS